MRSPDRILESFSRRRKTSQEAKAIKIDQADLSKWINKGKTDDIQKYNMARIEHAVKHGATVKAVRRRLGMGKNHTYGLKDSKTTKIVMK